MNGSDAIFAIFLIIAVMALGISGRLWKWLPVILLPIVWYVPRQTAPGGIFENFLILRWLTVIIIPAIAFVQLLRNFFSGKVLRIGGLAIPIIAFLLIAAYSAFINNNPFLQALGTIFLYLRYPLLFFIFMTMELPKSIVRVFIATFLILIILQIPECFYRYLFLGIGWDNISWSLGPWGAFDLGVYMIYATALLTASAIIKKLQIYHILLFGCFFALAILGEIKAFVVAAPLVAIVVIFSSLQHTLKRKTAVAVLLSAIILIFFLSIFLVWDKIYPDNVNALPGNLQELDNGGLTRIDALTTAWEYMKDDWHKLLFGLGPGSSLMGSFFGEGGSISEIPIAYRNQLAAIFVDSGILGASSYFMMLIILIIRIRRVDRRIIEPEITIISSAMSGIWLYYAILGPFYDLVWRHDSPNFIFYFFSAILCRYLYASGTRSTEIIANK